MTHPDARILVTEAISDSGLERLQSTGYDVDVQLDLSPSALIDTIPGASALIVRSATQVTDEVLDAGAQLEVVGRAGIGLDNIDLDAATRRGVLVVNAPQSNVISAAEHTIALLLAQARNIPQAHAALVDGRWERSRWQGVELHQKTLGIIGLGRIGSLVAQRAGAFGMELIATDPYVSPERARHLGIEMVSLEELVVRADFMTIHVAKTPETVGLVGKDLLATANPGLRLVNTSRGGVVDEEALVAAIEQGIVAGASLDVFTEEPTTMSPLFERDEVVVTPHLGASTAEAQDKAGDTIAEQVLLALGGSLAPFAVNVSAPETTDTVRAHLGLAERLGSFFRGLNGEAPAVLEVEYHGEIASHDTQILTLAVLKGLLQGVVEESISYVNAAVVARDRGIEVRETRSTTAQGFINLVTIRSSAHSVGGTLTEPRGEHRVVNVDDHLVELAPAPHMLVVRNDDRPGMIALVTAALGGAGINVSGLHLGRSPDGDVALQVLALDQPAPADLIEMISRADGIVSAQAFSL